VLDFYCIHYYIFHLCSLLSGYTRHLSRFWGDISGVIWYMSLMVFIVIYWLPGLPAPISCICGRIEKKVYLDGERRGAKDPGL